MGILRNQAANDHEFVDAALTYARRGWSIIPTIGKRSAHHWKQFQTTPADEPTLRRLFSRKGITGLAVILGRASGGLACRDFDDADAYHRWADAQPELAAILPTVRTARGFHVYFRGPDSFANLSNGEYRADAGHYCLLPPSRHPDGPTYTWQIMLPTGELPMVNPVSCGLLTQAHSGNGRVVDEILTLPPKQQLLTHPHPDQTQGKTQAYPPHTLHVSDDRVEAAIMATLPSGPGQRNRRLFGLARWLKSIMPGAAMDSLEAVVRTWHARALPFITTTDWGTTWVDFRIAWANVRTPVGTAMADIVATARAQTPPDADAIAKLVTLCRAMQAYHGPGQSWPLSCRLAGDEIGVSHDTAARLLKMLVIEGTIELLTPGGTKGSKRAAVYRFLG